MTHEELLVNTAINSWKTIVGRFNDGVLLLSEEQLQKQVAPGRNRLIYLLGHLTAVNDRMFSALGIGERLHPELDEIYIASPDRKFPDPLSAEDLKKAWSEVNTRLTAAFEKLTPEEWLQRHTAVSEEDFAKEPLRNRLAILLSRTSHIGFHSGQAVLTR